VLLLGAGVAAWGCVAGSPATLKAGAFLLFIALLAPSLSRWNLRRLIYSRRLPGLVCQGDRFDAGLCLTNPSPIAAAVVAIQDPLAAGRETPAAVDVRPCADRVQTTSRAFHRRGIHGPAPFTLTSDFPLGLASATLTDMLPDTVAVHPAPRLPTILLSPGYATTAGLDAARMRSDEPPGELRSLRPFQPGDRPRRIYWPASIRLHQLVVKELDDVCHPPMTIVHHSAHAPNAILTQRSFDLSLQMLAGLFLHAYAERGGFRFTAGFLEWKPLVVTPDRATLRDALMALARARMAPTDTVQEAVAAARRECGPTSELVVVGHTSADHWAAAFHKWLPVVLCFDNQTPTVRVNPWLPG